MFGVCESHIYRDDEDNEYLGKSNSDHPNVIANELIAYYLAKELDIRTPRVGFTRFEGQPLFLSKLLNPHLCGLDFVMRTREQSMNHPAELFQMLCFDMFIGNIDRKYDNMLFARNGDKHDLYIIDHERSLVYIGTSNGMSSAPISEQCHSLHPDSVKFTGPVIVSHADFVPFIQRVQALSDVKIHEAINQIEDGLLLAPLKHALFDRLRARRDNLQNCIEAFVRDHLAIGNAGQYN